MDIIVKTVLDLVQAQKGFENSIIAGGACRDHILGIEPKDYDIFLPYTDRVMKATLHETLNKELGISEREKGRDYGSLQNIRGVNEFTFEGKVFDLIFKNLENEDEFGKKVIADFDYGFNKIYYDGLALYEEHPDHQRDRQYWEMTLLNIDSLDALPKVIGKFNRVNEKLKEAGRGSLRFRNRCLRHLEEEPKVYLSSKTTTSDLWEPPVPQRAANLREAVRRAEERAAWNNPAGEIVLEDIRPRGEPIQWQQQVQGEWAVEDNNGQAAPRDVEF